MGFQQGSPWSVHHPDTGIDWNLIAHHRCKLGLNTGANEKQRVRWFWSISSGAQSVTLRKYLSYLSLVTYSFPILPIKPELGLQIGGRLLMAIQLDQSNYPSLSTAAGVRHCCAFYQHQHPVQECWVAKPILQSQTDRFWVFFIEFSLCRSHTDHRWSCC
jgi:hypothetical protein